MRLQLSQMGEEDYILVLHQYTVIRSPYASTMLPSFSGACDHKKQMCKHPSISLSSRARCCAARVMPRGGGGGVGGGGGDPEAPGVPPAFIMEGVPLLLQ